MKLQMNGEADISEQTRSDLLFIQQMLGELRNVAKVNDADMLMFLIEMAFAEVGDILIGKSLLRVRKIHGDQSPRVPV